MQQQIIVANYTLNLHIDAGNLSCGTIVRQPDGVEARFNTIECLFHLLEGLVGRRFWQANRSQLEAQVAALVNCA